MAHGNQYKNAGRGRDTRRLIAVWCSPAEIEAVDRERGELPRAEYVRRHGVPSYARKQMGLNLGGTTVGEVLKSIPRKKSKDSTEARENPRVRGSNSKKDPV